MRGCVGCRCEDGGTVPLDSSTEGVISLEGPKPEVNSGPFESGWRRQQNVRPPSLSSSRLPFF